MGYIKNISYEIDKDARCTNREYLIGLLIQGSENLHKCFVDDGGASYEAMMHYSIKCPYFGWDERGHCYKKEASFCNRENCVACKEEWLDMEVDE